jgi:hypothetical protein
MYSIPNQFGQQVYFNPMPHYVMQSSQPPNTGQPYGYAMPAGYAGVGLQHFPVSSMQGGYSNVPAGYQYMTGSAPQQLASLSNVPSAMPSVTSPPVDYRSTRPASMPEIDPNIANMFHRASTVSLPMPPQGTMYVGVNQGPPPPLQLMRNLSETAAQLGQPEPDPRVVAAADGSSSQGFAGVPVPLNPPVLVSVASNPLVVAPQPQAPTNLGTDVPASLSPSSEVLEGQRPNHDTPC